MERKWSQKAIVWFHILRWERLKHTFCAVVSNTKRSASASEGWDNCYKNVFMSYKKGYDRMGEKDDPRKEQSLKGFY